MNNDINEMFTNYLNTLTSIQLKAVASILKEEKIRLEKSNNIVPEVKIVGSSLNLKAFKPLGSGFSLSKLETDNRFSNNRNR